MRNKLSLPFFLLVPLFLSAAHIFFVAQDAYIQLWWLDIPAHLAGGLWIAWCYLLIKRDAKLLGMMSWVLGIGIIWEVMEYTLPIAFLGFGMPKSPDSIRILGTLWDLFVDMIASALFWFTLPAYYKYTKRDA